MLFNVVVFTDTTNDLRLLDVYISFILTFKVGQWRLAPLVLLWSPVPLLREPGMTSICE